jgi:hypothetical protein
MTDIVVDTNILSEILIQYFRNDAKRTGYIAPYGNLSRNITRALNRIIKYHSEDIFDDEFSPGLVIASTFAFVEIARKFNELSLGEYSISQFAAFIESPPEWFRISPLDTDLLPFLYQLPINVRGNDGAPLELADAVHVATALSREEFWMIATDKTIVALEILRDKLLT